MSYAPLEVEMRRLRPSYRHAIRRAVDAVMIRSQLCTSSLTFIQDQDIPTLANKVLSVYHLCLVPLVQGCRYPRRLYTTILQLLLYLDSHLGSHSYMALPHVPSNPGHSSHRSVRPGYSSAPPKYPGSMRSVPQARYERCRPTTGSVIAQS